MANSPYNFTSGVRDDTSFNRNWDSANLIVQQSDQVAYSNTSLTPQGTYNATYSFQNDRNGGLAEGFSYTAGAGCSFQVVDSYLGHSKVLQTLDAGAGSAMSTVTFTSAPTGGNISFWWSSTTTATTSAGNMFLLYENANNLVNIINDYGGGSGAGTFDLISGGVGKLIGTHAANRWYHFVVSFDTVVDKMSVTLDGVTPTTTNWIPFTTAGGAPTHANFDVTQAANSITIYKDAVDLSWTPGYVANRSAIDTGQLGVYNATLSFENATMFDQVGDNSTAVNGGTWTTDCGDFQHTQAMAGVESLVSGALINTAGWTCGAGTAGHGTFYDFGGYNHDKIIIIARGADDDYFYYPMASETFVYEAWVSSSVAASEWLYFVATDASGLAAGHYAGGIFIGGATFNYCTGNTGTSAAIPGAPVLSAYAWYNVRVEWSGTGASNYYRIYINGAKLVDTAAFAVGTTIARLYIGAFTISYSAYFDAIALSTEAGYYNGMSFQTRHDNKNLYASANIVPAVPTAATSHHNILMLNDQSNSHAPLVNYTLGTPQAAGTTEFWVYDSDVTKATGFQAWFGLGTDSGTIAFAFGIFGSKLQYYGVGAAWGVMMDASSTWYHVRVAWTGTAFSVWINGMLKASTVGYNAACATIGRIQYRMNQVDTAFQVYLDALDVSADAPAYSPERSTWMFLNATLSLPVAGAYSSKWVCWSNGIDYNQQPVPFTVTKNVQLISESSRTTRWIFGSGSSWTNIYTGNLSQNWYLTGTTEQSILRPLSLTLEDVYITDADPDWQAWGFYELEIGLPYGGSTYWGMIDTGVQFNYLDYSTLITYTRNYGSGTVYSYYTNPFDVYSVTWNTKPPSATLMESLSVGATITLNASNHRYVELRSSDWFHLDSVQGVTPPVMTMSASKIGSFFNSIYIQTNQTEALTLSSPTLSPISLQDGDRISVTFNTTSTHQINMLVGEETLKIVPEGNTNFNTQTASFIFTSAKTITNLNFTGLFDDATNLQIINILIDRPASVYSFYLNPSGQEFVSLSPSTCYLAITENLAIVNSTTVVIAPYILNPLIYTPIIGNERQVNLFDQQNRLLPFENFRVVLDRMNYGVISYVNPNSPYYMTTNRFYADDDSYYNCYVYDRFGRSILNRTSYSIQTFIDIQLNVYKLKIKNMAEQFCYVNITNLPYLGLYWSEWIAPGEIIAYTLQTGEYNVEITNQENSSVQDYSYNFCGDDFLLIGSQNTIAQAIWNIQNTNATLGNQITQVNISISNQNSQINNSIVMVDINLSNINSTLGNQLISLDSSITSVNNTIGVNFIATNTSIYEIGNWVNSSYSLLTTQVYQLNNSIYTAINVLDASLVSMNNSVNASFTTLIVKNDYLTYIFQHASFSSLLNWTSSYDITNDLYWTSMLNVARNTSLDVLLRYLNETDTIRVGAMETAYRYVPKGAEYRVWSVAGQTYLTEWTPLSVNATGTNNTAMLDFGSWQEPVQLPQAPPTLWETISQPLFWCIAFVGVVVAFGLVVRDKNRKILKARGYSESDAKHRGGHR